MVVDIHIFNAAAATTIVTHSHSFTAVIYFLRLLLRFATLRMQHIQFPCITQFYLVYSCSTFATQIHIHTSTSTHTQNTINNSMSFRISYKTSIPIRTLQMLSNYTAVDIHIHYTVIQFIQMNEKRKKKCKNGARNPQVCVTLTPC